MLKGIVFDFDGLLVDTELGWYDAYKSWLKENYDYDIVMADFLTCIGSTNHHYVAKLNEELNANIDHQTFNEEVYGRALEQSTSLPPMPGVLRILEQAKEKGIPCAIATSSPKSHPTPHLERLDLLKYFDVIVTADDVTEIKPSPELFNLAASKLGIPKENLVVFEDSLNGMKAANNAEIDVVVVPNGVTQYIDFPETYYKKVASLEEIDLDTLK